MAAVVHQLSEKTLESLRRASMALVNMWVGAEARGRSAAEMVTVAAEHFGNPALAQDADFVAAVEDGVRRGPFSL